MSRKVGKTKDEELIRVYKTVGCCELEIGGKIEGRFDNIESAYREGKKQMIWSFLPQLDESEVEQLLDSDLKIEYRWEWMKNEDRV